MSSLSSLLHRRLLLPGLGVAKSMGFGCACNLSYDELLVNPSTLLWIEKLCVPSSFEISPKEENQRFSSYAIRAMIDLMGENGLIEIVDEDKFLEYGREIKGLSQFVEEEAHDLAVASPAEVHLKENFINIGSEQFCLPFVLAGYSSQKMAHHLQVSCLLDRRFNRYLKIKERLLSSPDARGGESTIYGEIFSLVLPNDLMFPQVIYEGNEQCRVCGNRNECKDKFPSEVKRILLGLFELRNMDAFHVLREEIDETIKDISKTKNKIVTEDITHALRLRSLRALKHVHKDLPRISRWTNLAMIISAPIAYAAKQLNAPFVEGVAEAALVGAGVMNQYVKHQMSKNLWVDFLNKRTTPMIGC